MVSVDNAYAMRLGLHTYHVLFAPATKIRQQAATRRQHTQHGGTTEVSMIVRLYLTRLLGLCSSKLVDCCGGNIHHIRARPQEEDQNLGTANRPLRQWREDFGTIQIPVPG